ncbi:trypsin-like peptidase domain-containing protein [Microcoleus sp. FACHB-1515]|uniref:trypsin-like peptidase domain-containing protein n=1 Tax=Cyanophyceae TaxID=3028117 RepID=UPI00168806EB|nr:trypsin-like peptidase domain-containing protein [Microcoleus sp. FACHB-1515]MBD2090539.1 trypsin-like peptidase domain-containing protein [Microcoleus sp. FACHB-1515]
MNTQFLRLVASGLLSAGTAGSLFALNALSPVNLLTLTGQISQQAIAQTSEEDVNVRVYQQASPAVVSIDTGAGTGSGSIISADGLVLTAAHVVEGVEAVTVILSDGRRVQGDVIGYGDAGVDLAAVRLRNQRNLPTIPLATPGSVQVGQRAFAIGNPFGRFQNTFTNGIVSRIDANRGLIQTNAAINPGNSGGPLLNSQGQLIGVNNAIYTTGRDGGNIGIGFAIALDEVQPFLVAVREGRAAQTVQTPQIDANAQSITLNGQPISGTLSDRSSILPADDSYFNAYSFDGQAGQQVLIEMSSSDFDAYLILIGPDGESIGQDDDGGGGTNSRLIATLPASGRYTILANTYSAGETGDYSLRAATTSARPTTQTPRPGTGGASRPTPQGVILREQGVLGENSQVLEQDGSLYDQYQFQGRQGQQVTISMESSEFDTYLLLVDPNGQLVDQNDDGSQGSTNSQIVATLPADGTYTVIANAYDSTGRGRYTITVR